MGVGTATHAVLLECVSCAHELTDRQQRRAHVNPRDSVLSGDSFSPRPGDSFFRMRAAVF